MIEWLLISTIIFVMLVGCSRFIDTESKSNKIDIRVISTEEECSAEVNAELGQEAGADKRELKAP